MPERIPRGNPLLRIIDEDLPQQIQELAVESVRFGDDLVQFLHRADEFSGLPRRVGLGVVQGLVAEEARRAVFVVAFARALDFFD